MAGFGTSAAASAIARGVGKISSPAVAGRVPGAPKGLSPVQKPGGFKSITPVIKPVNGAQQPTFRGGPVTPHGAVPHAPGLPFITGPVQGAHFPVLQNPAGGNPAAGGTATTGAISNVASGPQLDSTAIANINDNLFKANQAISGAQTQQTELGGQLQSALAQLAQQQPLAQLRLATEANARGGLLSSATGQQQGNIASQFAEKALSDRQSYDAKLNALAQRIAGIQQGIPLYDDQQAAASAQYLSGLAGKTPIAAATAPPKAKATVKAAPKKNLGRKGR